MSKQHINLEMSADAYPDSRLTAPGGATLTAKAGQTWADVTSTMAPRRLDVHGLSMLQYPASELEAGLTNLWLVIDGVATALLGPASCGSTKVGEEDLQRSGSIAGLSWALSFRLTTDPLPGWCWRVKLTNRGTQRLKVQLVVAHDIALAPYERVRVNEYYVSQYLDLTPVEDDGFGTAIAIRQNMPGERAPWVAIASLDRSQAWASDAAQLIDHRSGRPTLDPTRLPSKRWQHEHSLAALGTVERDLAPGEQLGTGFVAVLVDDHPAATGPQDARLISLARQAAREPEIEAPESEQAQIQPSFEQLPAHPSSLFDDPVLTGLPAEQADLSRWFPGVASQVETSPTGELWSFTVGAEHVVLQEKEAAVLRPHGHILRTGSALTVETGVLTSTVWMDGVFTSQLTIGHVAHGRLLSGIRTYLGLQPAHGLRLFVEIAGRWHRLGQPSAWASSPSGARWCYRLPEGQLEVRVSASTDQHQLSLSVTSPDLVTRTLIAMQLALGSDDGQVSPAKAQPGIIRERSGTKVSLIGVEHRLDLELGSTACSAVGGDELIFTDGGSRGEAWCCVVAAGPISVRFSAEALSGDQLDSELWADGLWELWRDRLRLAGGADQSLAEGVGAVDAQVPWYQHNAMVHYLSPRGLEQFTGGAWGTRDVCQGPIGLLTAMGRDDAVRDVLLRTFAAQRPSGDWPQAFDFLPTTEAADQQVSHGDVVHWPLLAIGDYLATTGDASLLDEAVTTASATLTVAERIRLALAAIDACTIAGGPLPAYGHGDWNDSLQPADPRLAEHMVSTWTATLKIDCLRALAAGFAEAEREPELAEHCSALALDTKQAMLDHLLVDGELAGYGVTTDQPGGELELLVHPRDRRTGLTHGVLAWIHAIAGDQLSPAQARDHLDLIAQHLLGPDGVRLFDTPTPYRGGPMEIFQRAEAATFWGREIGLMYTHAHLRYCQALARVGAADELFDALLLAVPTGLPQRSPRSRPRQSNCYFSSSDAVFSDRAEASLRYPDLMAGQVELEGGWRIYSSGPGLFLRLLVEDVLGVRRRPDRLEIDPVLPLGLDGLEARVPLDEGFITVRYHFDALPERSSEALSAERPTHQIRAVSVDGQSLPLIPLVNPYRTPGVQVPRDRVPAGAILDVRLERSGPPDRS